jgi:predicted amidophosphoribosyltransferase
MADRLTVTEASETYASAMRNVLPAGPGVCRVCHTFIDPRYPMCYPCMSTPQPIDAVVPITYSEHLGQMHTALRGYKEEPAAAQGYPLQRLTGILWRFAEAHQPCVARAAGVESFDVVTTVPSSTPERDEARGNLRQMVEWCKPFEGRFQRVLRATGEVEPGRQYDPRRYAVSESVNGASVLMIDDTWVRGGHAQSAGQALLQAGAKAIGMIVIARHFHRDWKIVDSETDVETSGDRYDALPRAFDWDTCAVHDDGGGLQVV